ncbi:hypothetical protein L3Q82_019023 [Scortum barcoo]|uniref:Uncharacterized protein n=1 Tax=Scortum barcoo TaxID=214431 RepID=A0ACB8VG65_9TELE|nr:hypothetical protein L3Q82_019023 [Scortum barcoo]
MAFHTSTSSMMEHLRAEDGGCSGKPASLTRMPLEERHTAGWVEKTAQEFGLSLSDVLAVVHDNAANVVAALRILEEKHGVASHRCARHTLQLVVNHTLKKDPQISKALGAISRLLEHWWPVTATLSDPEVTQRGNHYLDLKSDQWTLLEELEKALVLFEQAFVFLSGEAYVTISLCHH